MTTAAAITAITVSVLLLPFGIRWIAAAVLAVLCAFFPRTVLLVLFAIVGIRVMLHLAEKERKP